MDNVEYSRWAVEIGIDRDKKSGLLPLSTRIESSWREYKQFIQGRFYVTCTEAEFMNIQFRCSFWASSHQFQTNFARGGGGRGGGEKNPLVEVTKTTSQLRTRIRPLDTDNHQKDRYQYRSTIDQL